jgi:hypothetical protein
MGPSRQYVSLRSLCFKKNLLEGSVFDVGYYLCLLFFTVVELAG